MRFEIRDDGVRRQAVHLRATGDGLARVLRAYLVAVQALREVWFGTAALGFQTFQRRYQQLSLQLISSLRALEEAVAAAGQDYAQAETDQQTMVNALAGQLGDPADPRGGLPVGGRAGDFVDGVGEFFGGVADEAEDFVGDVAEDVRDFGDDVGAGIGRIAGGVGAFVGGVVGDVGGLAGDVGSGIGEIASGDVPGGVGRIAGGVGAFVGDVAGGVGDLAGDVGDGVEKIAEGAGDLAGDIAREGGEFARGVGDEVGDLLDGDDDGGGDPDGGGDGDEPDGGGDTDGDPDGDSGDDDADGEDTDGDADGDGEEDTDGDDTQDYDRNGYWEEAEGPTPDPEDISTSEERREHILDGDGNGRGGGHRHGSGVPNKTTFPEDWTDDEIIENVEDVARNPDEPPVYNERRDRWVVHGTREEHGETVDITVIVTPEGEVITGYPTGGDGVHRNDGNGDPRPLDPSDQNEGG